MKVRSNYIVVGGAKCNPAQQASNMHDISKPCLMSNDDYETFDVRPVDHNKHLAFCFIQQRLAVMPRGSCVTLTRICSQIKVPSTQAIDIVEEELYYSRITCLHFHMWPLPEYHTDIIQ